MALAGVKMITRGYVQSSCSDRRWGAREKDRSYPVDIVMEYQGETMKRFKAIGKLDDLYL